MPRRYGSKPTRSTVETERFGTVPAAAGRLPGPERLLSAGVARRPHGDLATRRKAKLGEYVTYVHFDRTFAKHQRLGNLSVRAATRQETHHLAFSGRKSRTPLEVSPHGRTVFAHQ